MPKARMITDTKIVNTIKEIDLKGMMEKKGINGVAALAKLTRKDKATISKIINGKKEFTVKYYEDTFKKHLE